jgi:hypothetical protein
MAYEFETELEALPELEHELAGELEEEMEEEMEHEAGLEGEGWLGAIGNVVGSLLGEEEMEHEHEFEHEHEHELEHEISPIRKIYPDAMMEHLGELAAEAETEDEAAEHFLPLIGMAASKLLPVVARAAAPLARKLLPKVARAVTKAAPRLTKGIGQVAKVLHRNPQTRHLLKTVPTIARRTIGSLAHQAARGRAVTPRTAVRTLARQARRVLANPGQRQHALRRHKYLERRFHRAYGPGMARPHWRWGRGRRGYGRYPYWYGRGGVPRGVAPGAAPGVVYQPGVGASAPGVAPVRYGQVVGGRCTCPACPTAGLQYCSCCGQVLR